MLWHFLTQVGLGRKNMVRVPALLARILHGLEVILRDGSLVAIVGVSLRRIGNRLLNGLAFLAASHLGLRLQVLGGTSLVNWKRNLQSSAPGHFKYDTYFIMTFKSLL